MGIDAPGSVDAISMNGEKTTVTLTIFDAWDWSEEGCHLVALQEKLNSYFDFIQSRQIFESYPNAIGKSLHIDVVTQYPLTAKATELLRRADGLAGKLNARVTQRIQPT